jgi:Zn-dependent peptidase ImmA (M78 family)
MRDIALEQKAMLLLKKMNINKAPIAIEEIARMLNVHIGTASSPEYSGFLIRRKDSGLIGINSDDTYARQRFTIAHELGHFILEKKDTHIDDKSTVFYRNFNGDDVNTDSERIVNKFAAALLMPRNLLKNDFMKIETKGIFQENDLEYLAEKYVVSKEAMKYRLANLGLIKLKMESH